MLYIDIAMKWTSLVWSSWLLMLVYYLKYSAHQCLVDHILLGLFYLDCVCVCVFVFVFVGEGHSGGASG